MQEPEAQAARKKSLRLTAVSRLQRNNKSGCTGVRQHKCGKWVASINVDGLRIHLGLYKRLEDAVAARKAAEERYWGIEHTGKKENE